MPRCPDMPCAGCGKLMWRGKGVLPEGQARCRDCRKADVPEHGTRAMYRDRKCRCDECREWLVRANRAYRAERRAAGITSKGRKFLGLSCLGCGEIVSGSVQKDDPYHKACREKKERTERRRRFARERLVKASAGTSGWGVWTEGPCVWCNARFRTRGHIPAKYCSDRCSSRSRARGFKISIRARLAIYERDDWTCQLCMESVDPDLMTDDPLSDWAPSLDHIEPQSWALFPDHSPDNLRLAHRWCNSVRGDETYYTDDDLRAVA